MISRVAFRTFKSLQSVDLDLGPLTILVGPNGAGKTSVLQGMHLLSQLGLRRDGEQFHKAARLGILFSGRWHPRRLATRRASGFRLAFSEPVGPTMLSQEILSLACSFPMEDEQAPPQFVVDVPGSAPDHIELPEESPSANPNSVLNLPRLRRLSATVFLHLDAAVMSRPSLADDEEPRLENNGKGLASVLSYFAGAHPDRKAAIETALRTVVPRFRRVLIQPARIKRLVRRPFAVGKQAVDVPVEEEAWGHKMSLEFDGERAVPADMASEGTILALGLLTLLHGPSVPRLVLLDDVDRALHLGAQVRLVRLIREIQAQACALHADFQVVATTHSPFLLQEVSGEDVRVLALDAQGATHCRPLSSHPDYAKWRAVMTPGEIWANLGEDWVGHDG